MAYRYRKQAFLQGVCEVKVKFFFSTESSYIRAHTLHVEVPVVEGVKNGGVSVSVLGTQFYVYTAPF
jgi:hypothetical protein